MKFSANASDGAWLVKQKQRVAGERNDSAGKPRPRCYGRLWFVAERSGLPLRLSAGLNGRGQYLDVRLISSWRQLYYLPQLILGCS